MIIQCDACQARFKLPDEKLKPGGVKVRCTKCDTIFHVAGAQPEPEPAPTPPPTTAATMNKVENAAGDEFDFSDIDLDNLGDEPKQTEEDFDFDEFNMEDVESDEEAPADKQPGDEEASVPRSVTDIGDDLPDFDLPENFSFDAETDSGNELADFSPEELSQQTEQAPAQEFSADDLNEAPADDFTFGEKEEPTIGGDLGEMFDAEDDLGELPELGDVPAPEADGFGAGTEDEFSFNAQEPPTLTGDSPADGKTSGAIEFAFDADEQPLAEATADKDEPAADDFIFEEEQAPEATAAPAVQMETPAPEPESSARPPAREPGPRKRRKKGSARVKKRKKNRHTGLLLVLLLIAVLAGGYVYLAQQRGSWDPQVLLRHLQQLTGTASVEDPTARIELGTLRSSFVSNQNAGQLFAISGEVRNGYDHTRSAISVKGVIYDAKGKTVRQQTVFCGNPLDEAALRTLPFAKIEETMNNQFGDSLSNLDVAPGKAVPFTIVFKNLPDAVTEFNVEVADSRPGTR